MKGKRGTHLKAHEAPIPNTYLSLAMLELRDIDLGDISKSESLRYKKDSRRCGKFCRMRPALGEPPSSGDRAPGPFSTSKLEKRSKKSGKLVRFLVNGMCYNNNISLKLLIIILSMCLMLVPQ